MIVQVDSSPGFYNAKVYITLIYIVFCIYLKQVVVVIANILNGANLYGYIKCRVGGGKSIKDYATGIVSRQMLSAVSISLSKSLQRCSSPINNHQ